MSTNQSFAYVDKLLHVDEVALTTIAESVGTPVYVYSKRHFERQYERLISVAQRFGGRICYAVKANSNLAVLRTFRDLGAGFDIVSGGELQRVLSAGGDAAATVFSGVGKSTAEIDFALKVGVGCFNVESEGELERIGERAALLGKRAAVAVRVNPDVDPKTHPYISTGLKQNKFGVPRELALTLYERARAHDALDPVGLACHIGSQITDPTPLLEALDSLLALLDTLDARGIELKHLDLGGGFGTTYDKEPPFDLERYGDAVAQALTGRKLDVYLEPGRFLVANGGVLLTTVEYVKARTSADHVNFAVVDAAMNDLLRPALYQAWHGVDNVRRSAEDAREHWDVVGPVCESADFLAKDRLLEVGAGDLLAVYSAGAYAMGLASNYNTRPRPPEVLVDGADFHVVRRRETVSDLLRLELPEA